VIAVRAFRVGDSVRKIKRKETESRKRAVTRPTWARRATPLASRGYGLVLPQGTGSRYIGEEAGKRRAALLCAAAEAFVPA
jgi:hypothetical protein